MYNPILVNRKTRLAHINPVSSKHEHPSRLNLRHYGSLNQFPKTQPTNSYNPNVDKVKPAEAMNPTVVIDHDFREYPNSEYLLPTIETNPKADSYAIEGVWIHDGLTKSPKCITPIFRN